MINVNMHFDIDDKRFFFWTMKRFILLRGYRVWQHQTNETWRNGQ